MCGFLAAFGPTVPTLRSKLNALASRLVHRGPDSTSVYEDSQSHIVFHRLAIRDISSAADQPMTDVSGRFVIAFNGEIYNSQVLRRALVSRCTFRTTGDTEILLNGLTLDGVHFLDRVEGMFSFVLWDTLKCEVLAARDPFGIKPLYFAELANCLIFASEPRPLRLLIGDNVCSNDLAELLVFRHLSNQRSGFRRVRSLKPGCYLQGNCHYNKTSIFSDPLALLGKNDVCGTQSDWTDATQEHLQQTVTSHTQSDVGYAVQLSGGVDSSLIAAMCRQTNSGSLESYGAHIVDYHDDERAYRDMVVTRFNLRHQEVEISSKGYADAFPEVIAALDAPSPHYGCIALYLVAKAVAQSHRVVLTGEGADEMFGGYSRYSRIDQLHSVTTCEEHGMPPARDSVVMASAYTDPERIYRLFPDLDFSFEHRRLLASRFPDSLRQLIALDIEFYLASLLLRQDRVCMAHGVEARVPFVHWPLAQFLASIPLPQRIGGAIPKALLKRVATRLLPAALVKRRKNGLTLPIRTWLTDESSLGRYLPLLTDSDSHLSAYADRRQIQALILEERKRNASVGDGGSLLMQLLNVEIWLRSLSAERAISS